MALLFCCVALPNGGPFLDNLRMPAEACPVRVDGAPATTLWESPADWNSFVNEVRRQALQFTEDLPNFICTQTTRRYFNTPGSGRWQVQDTIEAELSFNESKEQYSSVRVNGRMSAKRFESLGGTLSVGEFGSILRALFLPEVQTAFRKEREELLRGKSAVVIAFTVPQATSQWTLSVKTTHSLRVAYRGWIWVDPGTHQVLKITQRTDRLPAGFPIVFSETTTEYGLGAIGGIQGQQFLLPLSAELIIQEAQPPTVTRNLIEFSAFRRFSAEVKLKENE